VRILAVDPGGTTGLAEWCHGDFTAWEEPDPMQVVHYALIEARSIDEIVCEDFRPRPGVRTWQPDALHVIGGLRYVTWYMRKPLTMQSPGAAKSFATDARLRKAGFWTPGKGHANDAARHLLRRMVRLHLIDLEDIL
jgi:hypothetical protein